MSVMPIFQSSLWPEVGDPACANPACDLHHFEWKYLQAASVNRHLVEASVEMQHKDYAYFGGIGDQKMSWDPPSCMELTLKHAHVLVKFEKLQRLSKEGVLMSDRFCSVCASAVKMWLGADLD